MEVVRFAAASFFFFVLGSQGIQVDPAYAGCCGCTCTWWMGCTCRGLTDPVTGTYCAPCHSTEPVLRTSVSINESGEQLTPGNESVPETSAQLDVTEGVIELMNGGKCFRNKVALNLLRNVRDDLKYVPVRF
jgi:hypothetical protein